MQKSRGRNIWRWIAAFVILFDLGAAFFYSSWVYREAKDEAYRELEDFSDQVRLTARLQIEGSVASVVGMSNGFSSFENLHSDKALRLLNKLNENTDFTRMFIVTPDGEALYHDGVQLDLEGKSYVSDGLKGMTGISEIVESQYSGDSCFAVYTPIYSTEGEIMGALCGIYEPNELRKVISVKSFDYGGGSYLYESNGEHIVSSVNPNNLHMGDDTIQGLIDTCSIKETDLQNYIHNLRSGDSGFLEFKKANERYLGYYQPVGINDWYVMCVTSNVTIMKKIERSTAFSMILLLGFAVTLSAIGLYLVLRERDNRKAEVKRLEDKQSRMTEQYANEIKNSYDAIFEFDYTDNTVYRYNFTEEGFERTKAQYDTLTEALDALTRETVCNTDVGDLKDYFSREHLNKLFLAGRNELNIDVQKRNEAGIYNWFTLFVRKVHWSADGDQIAMFYAKNVNELYKEQRQSNQLTLDALKMAKEANRAKSDFLARMSHDIRTPMNAIMGMTAIAKVHLDDTERLKDCFSKIENASQYLLSLINDVLDMSRIESGKMELQEEEVVFNDFFEEIRQLIKPEADKKEIQFIDETKQADHPVIYADRLHLQQIFMNLLSNAVKFTHSGGTVTIHAEQFDESSHHVLYRFTVSDTGVGIDKGNLDKIFQPFERVNEGNQTGTGLGLSIAQNLLTLMNGIITVESKVNRGTTFTVEIPFRKAEKKEQPAERKLTFGDEWKPDFGGKRVLLAEDNDINMEIARIFLENVNLKVDTASNGKEALKLYEKNPADYYDLVITDIRMPVMDGRELTKRIRKSRHSDGERIPIIAMSADAFSEEIQLSQSVGMNDYVTKPINARMLYETIHKLL